MDNIPRTLLQMHLNECKSYIKGRLLNAGCGDKTYESFYRDKIETQIRFDWPNTIHDKNSIDVFGSVMELPFISESFDVVFCTEVLEHVPEPQKALAEFHRVLNKSGYLILSTPFLYQLHETPFDFYRYTAYGLSHLINKAGFELVFIKSRGDLTAVLIFLTRKFIKKILSKLLGVKLVEKLPLVWMDWLYLRLRATRVLKLDPYKNAYTLGYTVVALKR